MFVKTVVQPLSSLPEHQLQTIVTICCNHRDGEYFLHWITRKLGSTATSTVITRLLPLTNYISDAENETQRALLGHTNGNIEMHSPPAAAMLTMVAAATIVQFPPVCMLRCIFGQNLEILTSIGGDLSRGQAENGANFDFLSSIWPWSSRSIAPKTIGILTKVFYISGPNLVILA